MQAGADPSNLLIDNRVESQVQRQQANDASHSTT